MAKWKIGSIAPLALSLIEWAPQLVDMSLRVQGYEHIAGHHFFADVEGANTPTFAFDRLSTPFPMTQVAKLANVSAPAHACAGKNGLPAVDWLYLQHKTGITQGGINTVYRVETAGGNKPATCKGMPATWEVKYAAQCKSYPKHPRSSNSPLTSARLGIRSQVVSAQLTTLVSSQLPTPTHLSHAFHALSIIRLVARGYSCLTGHVLRGDGRFSFLVTFHFISYIYDTLWFSMVRTAV
jgi:hypothetical protein